MILFLDFDGVLHSVSAMEAARPLIQRLEEKAGTMDNSLNPQIRTGSEIWQPWFDLESTLTQPGPSGPECAARAYMDLAHRRSLIFLINMSSRRLL